MIVTLIARSQEPLNGGDKSAPESDFRNPDQESHQNIIPIEKDSLSMCLYIVKIKRHVKYIYKYHRFKYTFHGYQCTFFKLSGAFRVWQHVPIPLYRCSSQSQNLLPFQLTFMQLLMDQSPKQRKQQASFTKIEIKIQDME